MPVSERNRKALALFNIVNTWKNVTSAANQQRGFPAPGTGAQQTNSARQPPPEHAWLADIPYEGSDTWPATGAYTYGNPTFPVDAQRGQPAAEAQNQQYPRGALNQPMLDGRTLYRETREFSRGMQRYAPITPYVLATANPGDIVPFRPSVVPRYPLGQYINNTIFWTNQVIPTSVPLAGLQTEKSIDELLSTFQVYGKAQAI